MARRSANQLVINVSAGTAQLVQDMEKNSATVTKFGTKATAAGHSTRASMIEASASIRALEGNFTNNIRAVERFTSVTLGLGPVFNKAFAFVGAAATVTIIGEMVLKVNEFFKTIRDAPNKIDAAFRSVIAPMRQTNDELQLAIDRTNNEIAKLEGRRQNTLKIMLDEAVVSADKLGTSLNKVFDDLNKHLTENRVGLLRQLFGEGGTKDITKFFGGEAGAGGLGKEIADIRERGEAEIRAARIRQDAKGQAAAENKLEADTLAALAKGQKFVTDQLEERESQVRKLTEAEKKLVAEKIAPLGFSADQTVATDLSTGHSGFRANEESARQQLRKLRAAMQEAADDIQLTALKREADAKLAAAQARNDNSKIGRPLKDALEALDAKLAATQLKLSAIGKDEGFQVVAKGAADALIEIEKVRKQLEHDHQAPLTSQNKAEIQMRTEAQARVDLQTTWNQKLDEATKRIKDEVLAQETLTAAIGKGYAAVKEANILATIQKEFGPEKFNQLSPAARQKAITERGPAYDAAATARTTEATDKLNDQIELETILARVQIQGAAAVELATLKFRLEKLQKDGVAEATQEQIKRELELYRVHGLNQSATEKAKLEERITAITRLARAQQDGAEAVRKAENENRYAELRKQPGIKPEDVDLARAADEAQHQKDITTKVYDRINAHKNLLETLDQEEAKIQESLDGTKASVEQERALVAIAQERLKIAVEESLAGRSAKDGIRAFFIEMREQGKSAAESVYQALNSALDRTADQFARLITGQKTNFKQAFQEVGSELLKDQIKGGLQKGIGAIGKLLGVPGTGAILTKSNPGHVIVDNLGGGGLGSGAGNPLEIPDLSGANAGHAENLGIAGGILGILGRFGGGFAGGGDVSPGMAYLVGERGPELFSPSTHGTISSHNSFGGGMVTYQIDARGADLGAGNRVTRAIEAAHASAVATGVRANVERQRRTPQRN